jgi:RNA polymerase sigma-70 factor (ECF subfamily)
MATPGNPQLVQRLVDEHYMGLYRYAVRLSGSPAEAEDLTQEAFCKAQASLAQLRDQGRARPWLFRILRNLYLHRIRADRQQHTVPLDSAGDVAERLPDALPEVDGEQLQNALNQLPEVYRTAVILYYFEDFSYRDIAEQMDLPIGTVMSRLARAKGHLRNVLLRGEPVTAASGVRQGRANDGL